MTSDSAARTIYLKKANDDLVSHCACAEALVTFPPQMDCPWCGCGWLFTCVTCRKAFTFAVGVERDETLEELARLDLSRGSGVAPDDAEVRSWADAMRELLADVRPGETYVCIDGRIIGCDAEGVRFDGWSARHDLPRPPQVMALSGGNAVLDRTLGDRDYWIQRRLAE